MIIDARNENVALNRSTRYAIVGAGPAGMTLARELSNINSVLLIESGGFEANADVQALYTGECVGIKYPLTDTRARQFGGSSALWAGYCAIFDPHDFLQRDWVPTSGWPFGIDEIEPYYASTAKLLNLNEPNFDARYISSRVGVFLPFDDGVIVPTAWRFGTPKIEYGKHLREEFETSENLTTLIHANVVDIRLDSEHSMVTELIIRTLDGRQGRVAADIVVLACGGIETPRILLNADTQVRCGLGNSNDMVGRFFMEHPHIPITSLRLHDIGWFKNSIERGIYDDNRQFMLAIGLSEAAQKEAGILNARAHIYRTPLMSDDEIPKIGLFLEQAPNPNSRITLSEKRDILGMRRVRLDWRLTELDWKTFEKTGYLLGQEFERVNAGKMHLPSQSTTYESRLMIHSNHHLGTTRMANDRTEGVVDPNCRVHDLSNLFIIGGSIFPTSSWANPTFTLITLTLRLADHLRSEYGSM